MPLAQTRLETLQICKLLQCVREEERVQIEKLTLNGVPHLINYNEPTTGETALSTAAAANNDSMIEYLIELGAYPDVKDFEGRTAVMRAAELGNIHCVEALAKAECNMKLTDNNGKGVLFYCISPTTRHEKCMQIVIAHGADVNNTSKDTCPVFLAACEIASQVESPCLSLLGKGADPNSKNEKTNRTALMAACASGSVKVVRSVLEGGGEIDVVMLKSKVHAAHEAARGGYLEVLMVLAAFGANFDQYDEKGNTPIHYAAQNGHAMCCKYLSQRGCNPKPKNDEGLPAKAVSKENGHKEATKECKKAEKSFGKGGKNNDPWALKLYDFCCEKEEQFREMFIKYDAEEQGTVSREDFLEVLQNINVPMPEEAEMKTLLIAHDNKNKDGVMDYNEFLVGKKYVNKQYLRAAFEPKSKKKKKGGKGKKGKTKIPLPICTQVEGPRAPDGGPPPDYIPRHDHYTDLGRFSRDQPPEHPLQDDSGWYLHHPERTYMRLNDAAKHNDLDSMTGVFEKNKTLVDTKDKFYKTPLMIACLHGNLQVTKFLVNNGANLQSEDNFRWTPLHFACHSGMYDVIEYLVDKGANIDAVTMNGATPFMRAIESSRPEIVQYLLEKGVKVQTETRKGHTPMDLAAAWADARVFQIVKTKWDSLPPPPDKKDQKKGGAKKGGGAKRPGSSSPAKALANAAPDSPDLDLPGHHRKGSILRAASALAGGIEEVEDITFTPIKRWTEQPTSEQLIEKRVEQRDRFGWEVDFEDFKMPLMRNVYARVEVFGGIDAE